MDIQLISAHMLDSFEQLWAFRKWDMGININPEDETSYTTQYQDMFLKYVDNEYCTKYSQLSVSEPERILRNNLFPTALASVSGQSTYDRYDLATDGAEYWRPEIWLKQHPDASIMQLTYWQPEGSSWIHLLNCQSTVAKIIQIWMITTPTVS